MPDVITQIARQAQRKFYGKFRAFVVDNQDPDKLARLRLRIPAVLGEETSGWALPCLPYGGLAGQGFFSVPEVGAQLWAEFEEGEVSLPIWTGTFWQQPGDPPTEAALEDPTARLIKTGAGHMARFDDTEGDESFTLQHPQGASVSIDAQGTITIQDAAGAKLTLDASAGTITVEDSSGNTITTSSTGTKVEDSNGGSIDMGPSGITVKGQTVIIKGSQVMLGGDGGEPVIKGTSFLTLFATHIHPTGMGPSGPPIPQGEMSSLSTTVTST